MSVSSLAPASSTRPRTNPLRRLLARRFPADFISVLALAAVLLTAGWERWPGQAHVPPCSPTPPAAGRRAPQSPPPDGPEDQEEPDDQSGSPPGGQDEPPEVPVEVAGETGPSGDQGVAGCSTVECGERVGEVTCLTGSGCRPPRDPCADLVARLRSFESHQRFARPVRLRRWRSQFRSCDRRGLIAGRDSDQFVEVLRRHCTRTSTRIARLQAANRLYKTEKDAVPTVRDMARLCNDADLLSDEELLDAMQLQAKEPVDDGPLFRE